MNAKSLLHVCIASICLSGCGVPLIRISFAAEEPPPGSPSFYATSVYEARARILGRAVPYQASTGAAQMTGAGAVTGPDQLTAPGDLRAVPVYVDESSGSHAKDMHVGAPVRVGVQNPTTPDTATGAPVSLVNQPEAKSAATVPVAPAEPMAMGWQEETDDPMHVAAVPKTWTIHPNKSLAAEVARLAAEAGMKFWRATEYDWPVNLTGVGSTTFTGSFEDLLRKIVREYANQPVRPRFAIEQIDATTSRLVLEQTP